MQIIQIGTKVIEPNNGQIPGLQRNPRTITKADIKRIAQSLKETPELFDMRPCIVYPMGGRFILLGGNLRYLGAVQNGAAVVPCIVVPPDTAVEKLREIVIKDNGAFGAWDYDLLANEWDNVPLNDWGVDTWEPDDESDDEKSEEKPTAADDLIKAVIVFEDEPTRSRFLAAYGETIKKEYNATIIEK